MIEQPPCFHLRPTRVEDLDSVLAIERHPDNRPYIGQWSLKDHAAACQSDTREHWIIERTSNRAVIGYIIAYDLVRERFGVYVKRIVVSEKTQGIGRAALRHFVLDVLARRLADSACLVVYRSNERAQRSYRSIGFAEVHLSDPERASLRAIDEGFPEDAVFMRVPLTTLQVPVCDVPPIQPTAVCFPSSVDRK